MDVRLGWSGEIHGTWTKMDVEVEENDLSLHFYDAGVREPDSLKYSPIEKFKLMYAIGEVFVLLHKMSRFPEFFGTDEHKKELRDLRDVRDSLTKKIIERADEAPF